jgi:hypothetical protein
MYLNGWNNLQAYVTVADFGYPVEVLWFPCSQGFFGFPMFWPLSIPDEGYSRNVLHSLNQISTFWWINTESDAILGLTWICRRHSDTLHTASEEIICIDVQRTPGLIGYILHTVCVTCLISEKGNGWKWTWETIQLYT